jgi:hypothetical protein
VAVYQNRMSLRGITRIFGFSYQATVKFIK